MATQRIEDDDYGVEIIRPKNQQVAPKVVEEKKTASVTKPKPTQPATATKPAQQEVEELDEEDMYGEGTNFAGVQEENDGF